MVMVELTPMAVHMRTVEPDEKSSVAPAFVQFDPYARPPCALVAVELSSRHTDTRLREIIRERMFPNAVRYWASSPANPRSLMPYTSRVAPPIAQVGLT